MHNFYDGCRLAGLIQSMDIRTTAPAKSLFRNELCEAGSIVLCTPLHSGKSRIYAPPGSRGINNLGSFSTQSPFIAIHVKETDCS
jgi:hypothetical protein